MHALVPTFSTWQRRGLPRTSPLRCPPTYSVRVNEFPCGGAFFPRSDGLSNRRDCVANLQRRKTYGSRDYEDALASHFHHRREQRIICSWHHRCARVLPDRI